MSIELIRAIRQQTKAATRAAVASRNCKFALWNPSTGDRLHFD